MKNSAHHRSKKRIRDLGEVFTPEKYVHEMLDMLDKSVWADANKVFFEPTCGHGNFVIAIVERRLNAFFKKAKRQKIKKPHFCAVENTLNNLWAIDVDSKNIDFCQSRVWNLVFLFLLKNEKKTTSQTIFIKKNKDFFTHVICCIKWQIQENEALSCLEDDPVKAKKAADKTIISRKWFKKNKHKFIDFEVSFCEFCKKSGNKKIIAVGNPPYHEKYQGNSTAAKNIFNIFLDSLIDNDKIDDILLVIPARWYSGGRGLDNFRKNLFESNKIKLIKDFEIAENIFPTVQIKGGVCFFLYSKSYNGEATFSQGNKKSKISLQGKDFLIRDIEAYSIVDKIDKKEKTFMNSVVWSIRPFGLSSNYFDKNKEDKKTKTAVSCITKDRINKVKFIEIDKINKNRDRVFEYQVICPKAIKTGGVPPSSSQFLILNKGEICTETYNVIHSFKSKKEAERFLKYLQTDFVRFLISLLKITHDMIVKTWQCVPLLDIDILWTDEKLFNHFKLTKFEQEHIKRKIKKWNLAVS